MLPDVVEVRLDNGFRAFLVERHNLPVVASMIWYQVGSRDERTGETGLSHFLEHMMFKGTEKYAKGEIDLLTSKMGGSNNAFTDNDNTAYYFSLASDRWETALEIEASRMSGCLIDEDELTAEKSVVLEELAMGEDDPWRELFHAAEGLAYQVHPYHHPIIGWREDVVRVTAAEMSAYYRRHYGPNRAFLVAVGDFDAGRTGKRIARLFGSHQPVEPRVPVLPEPPVRGERRSTIRAPGDLTRLALAGPICRMGERDDFVLDVLAHVLGSGRSSRLHRRLVLQDELATHVSTTNEPRVDPGLFWLLAELRPGVAVERAEATIREEIDRLCRDGVTAGELRRARVQIRSSFLFEEETVLDTAMKIGRFEASAVGGHQLLRDVLPIYDSLDRREIRDAAVRYLAPGRWSVVWSMPREEQATAPARAAKAARAASPRARAGSAGAQKRKVKKRAAKKRAARKGARRPATRKNAQPGADAARKPATARRTGRTTKGDDHR